MKLINLIEIKINNPSITPEMIIDLYNEIMDILYKSENNYLDNKFNTIIGKYIDPTEGDASILGNMRVIKQKHPKLFIDIYNSLKKFKDNYLTDLSEIKINNPSQNFKVTDTGLKVLDIMNNHVTSFNKLVELIPELDYITSDELFKEPDYQTYNLFYILNSKYGENIIKTNEINTLEDYLKNYIKIWAGNRNSGINDLKIFIDKGLITKIQL